MVERCILSLGKQKLLKINLIPYRFFRTNFYRLNRMGGGGLFRRRQRSFRSYILILKYENYVQVSWVLSPYISVCIQIHWSDTLKGESLLQSYSKLVWLCTFLCFVKLVLFFFWRVELIRCLNLMIFN